jgi:hypothetical protein
MEQQPPSQKNSVVVGGTIGWIVGACGGVLAPHDRWWEYPLALLISPIIPALFGMFVGALYREIKHGR